jgi:hypothetical protein
MTKYWRLKVDGVISYLRTAAEIKSLISLGFKKVIELLKSRKVRVRLQPLMQYLLFEKKEDQAYLDRICEKILEWQAARDARQLTSAILLYHNSGAKALHGFRYQIFTYEKKDRALYQNQRRTFSQKERAQWVKNIATTSACELIEAGISQRDIEIMLKQGRAPTGYDVHHRIALDDGGTNDFNNLILIRNDVEHRSVHGYYNPGELRIKLLSVGDKAVVALPVPPANAVIYPNPARGYYCEQIPNSQLVELYDVD